MWKELHRRGEQVPRCQVQRLMHEHGIQGAKRRGRPWRTTKPDPGAEPRADLVKRDFTASGPRELLVADLTYVRCWEGLVFFAFVLDVYSRRIVGWQLAAHMRASLVVDALQMALGTRERVEHVELVHHSDRGSQYTSAEFAAVLAENAVAQSVGSTGDAYDNAMAESFVDTLKTELIADRVWRTRSQLELAIVEWVGWYNTRRLHSELGDVPPVEFKQAHLATSGPVDHRAGGISLRSPSGLARLCLARRTGVSALAGQTLAWDDNRKLRPNAGRVTLPTKATLLRDLDRECCFAPWLLHKPPANPLDRF